uniref:FERM adjacent domain-containing protein n=1 Tax=Sander lucioperca TaxID=283035 RepID=A0A8C9XJ94_SANLU
SQSETRDNLLITFKNKKLVLTFHTSTPAACKHLWKCGVENQAFYKCAKSSQIKTVSSSNIFFKGSRFRYSGRVAKEVIEASSKIQREPPEVTGLNLLSSPPLLLPNSFPPSFTPHPTLSLLPSFSHIDLTHRGVDLLFSSPVQSPARLLRELHADPDIQAQLEAERERDRAYERTRLAARSRMGGVLTSSLLRLSSNERVNACLLSVARFVAVVMGVLLVTVPTLLLLLESDIDVSFLHEIRQTPEFEQFHYEYYCPLRRWILCRISMVCSLLMLTS